MTDLHMILLGVGILLLIGFAWIVKRRNDYYREFIAGVPMRFYTEESRHPLGDVKCRVSD